MAKHIVTLKYDNKKGFIPPDDLKVSKGDTISFNLETTPPVPNATFEVTMDGTFFKPHIVSDSESIEVIEVLQNRITYECKLIGSDGKPIFVTNAQQPGGGVRPGHN
jgi:hypothetical protein